MIGLNPWAKRDNPYKTVQWLYHGKVMVTDGKTVVFQFNIEWLPQGSSTLSSPLFKERQSRDLRFIFYKTLELHLRY